MELEEMNDDEILNEAMKQGYNPDYDGEKKKTPKEFLEVSFNHNKMLKERNEKLSIQIDDLNSKLNSIVQFQEEQKKKAVEKAIRELKVERKAAIDDGDHERIEAIDEEIEQQKVAKPENNPILDAWLAQNPWYRNDEELAIEADIIAQQLSATGRYKPDNQADYQKLLSHVETRVKKAFPDKFKNPKKDNPPEVESGRASPQSQSKHTYADLPAEAKKACDTFVRDGLMTKEQYLEMYEWD